MAAMLMLLERDECCACCSQPMVLWTGLLMKSAAAGVRCKVLPPW